MGLYIDEQGKVSGTQRCTQVDGDMLVFDSEIKFDEKKQLKLDRGHKVLLFKKHPDGTWRF